MKKELFTLGEVARQLKVEPYKIHYLLACHKIEEPQLRIGSRRIWTAAEIKPIAERLKSQAHDEGGDDER